ncbi:MAG: AAA family ATPase [Oscillospiraceae bacterium]|nr:AAA family ATPase [Oscillospiraceae bacterium]
MQIREMNATFGKLKNDTLTLQPGLNCIYAANESGKSTWSHFLRVMLYGINTRDRGPLADKHRFAPWAGWAMSGRMDLVTDEGETITLRRDTVRATAPMGDFSCTYAGTATPVAGIGKENAGEMLLGVGQEVFARSAFIRHSALAVDKDAELERRIAALITTGEEEISYSEVQGRLKKQLNRRRHNKTGLLPALETELSALQTQLAHIEDLRRQAYEAQQLLQQYEAQRQDLEQERQLWKQRTLQVAAKKLAAAEDNVKEAAARVALLREAYPSLPEDAVLSAIEGHYAALQTTLQRAKEGQEALSRGRLKEDSARRAWEGHTLFPAKEEELRLRLNAMVAPKMPSPAWWVAPALAAIGCGVATYFYLQASTTPLFAAAIGTGVAALGAAIAILARSYSVKKKQSAVAAQRRELEAQMADYLPLMESWAAAADELERGEMTAESLRCQSISEVQALLEMLQPFAPVQDVGGVQVALHTLHQQKTRLQQATDAQQKAELQRDILAQNLPEGAREAAQLPLAEPTMPKDAVAERLPRVLSMEQSARSRLDTLTGQLRSMGEADELRFRLKEKESERSALQEEYDAIAMAMEVLDEANTTLQNRFSPALGARSAEIFRRLTAGRYEKVLLSRDFSLETEEEAGGMAHSVHLLSQGAADQLYLAVRLAICDMVLPEDKSAPLILDDALLSFDEDRLHAALDYLVEESKRRQILLFSCQKREQEYLEGRENVTLLTL